VSGAVWTAERGWHLFDPEYVVVLPQEPDPCYRLTLATEGQGQVFSLTPPNCEGGRYTSGTVVHLRSEAAVGWYEDGWPGADYPNVQAGVSSNTATMTSDRHVTVRFRLVTPSPQYTFSASLGDGGKTTYAPGDTLTICYEMEPEDVPFTLVLYRRLPGQATFTALGSWADSGGGDCQVGTVSDDLGPREYLLRALVSGNVVGTAVLEMVVEEQEPPAETRPVVVTLWPCDLRTCEPIFAGSGQMTLTIGEYAATQTGSGATFNGVPAGTYTLEVTSYVGGSVSSCTVNASWDRITVIMTSGCQAYRQ
jgi:hypothetical protein